MKHFIIGGARSGKSRYAELWASERNKSLHYVATAEAGDEEMRQRIAHHRKQRDGHWQVTEEPLQLAAALEKIDHQDHCIVVDCLTLWLSNCLAANNWAEQREVFIELLPQLQADLVLVSNEVGSGIVPLGELSRRFVDESGRLHQQLASHCDRVTTVIAGLPLSLKEASIA